MTTPLQQAIQQAIHILESADPLPCEIEAANDLQEALNAELQQPVEPYAVFHGLVDSGEHGAFNLDLLKMIPRGAYLYLHPPQPQATTSLPAEVLEAIRRSGHALVKTKFGYRLNFIGAATAQGEKP